MSECRAKPYVNRKFVCRTKSGPACNGIICMEVTESRVTGTQRIFTARAASRATIVREIKDWTIMPSFAQRDKAAVSVGEKAVLVLKARNR